MDGAVDNDEDDSSEYMRTDIPHDVASSLRLMRIALQESANDRSWWKWVIVSAHMAAATAMVGYLTASDGTGALDEKSSKQWRTWHDMLDPRPDPPERRLADFGALLRRATKGQSGFGESVSLADLEPNLRQLNLVRNEFNHFDERGWSIHIPYVLPLVQDAVHLVQRIEAQGWAFRHNTQSVRSAAEDVDKILKKLAA